MKAVIVWLIASFCAPIPESTLVAEWCHTAGGETCCRWAYIMDRYCCPEADMIDCEDDCTRAERIEDERNALWATEVHCIDTSKLLNGHCHTRNWQYAGGGLDGYSESPGLWATLIRYLTDIPQPSPLSDYEECLIYAPNPYPCDEYDPID